MFFRIQTDPTAILGTNPGWSCTIKGIIYHAFCALTALVSYSNEAQLDLQILLRQVVVRVPRRHLLKGPVVRRFPTLLGVSIHFAVGDGVVWVDPDPVAPRWQAVNDLAERPVGQRRVQDPEHVDCDGIAMQRIQFLDAR